MEDVFIKQGAPPHDASSCLQEKESRAVLCKQKAVQTVYSAQAADFLVLLDEKPAALSGVKGRG